jgi:hypothetical protein
VQNLSSEAGHSGSRERERTPQVPVGISRAMTPGVRRGTPTPKPADLPSETCWQGAGAETTIQRGIPEERASAQTRQRLLPRFSRGHYAAQSEVRAC